MTEFGGPNSVEAVVWRDLFGRLLAIWPYGREMVETKYGEKAAVRADIYDLDAGAPVAMDALIFPRALVMQTSSTPHGKAVVGRLGQGEPRAGGVAPWKLADPTPGELQRAMSYFGANPSRVQQLTRSTPAVPTTGTASAPVATQSVPSPVQFPPPPPSTESKPPF